MTFVFHLVLLIKRISLVISDLTGFKNLSGLFAKYNNVPQFQQRQPFQTNDYSKTLENILQLLDL